MGKRGKVKSKRFLKLCLDNTFLLMTLIIIVVIVLAGFFSLQASKIQSRSVDLDENLDNGAEELKLNGRVYGEGKVKVYLKSNGENSLIFDSAPRT